MKLISKNNYFSLGSSCILFLAINGCHPSKSDQQKNRSSINLGLVQDNSQTQEMTDEQKQELEKQTLIAEAQELEAKIKNRYSDLERERDRNQELKTSLLGKTARGCFADQKIESLEIIFDGARSGTREINSNTQLSGAGSPQAIKIMLGPNISITNDEGSNSMFPGSVTQSDLAELRVSDIEYLKIEKGGYTIESNCTDKPLFKSCNYTNLEYDRYQLDSVKVIVNGETVYHKTLYSSHIFQKDATEWIDESFQTNQAWMKAMKIDDCSQQQ